MCYVDVLVTLRNTLSFRSKMRFISADKTLVRQMRQKMQIVVMVVMVMVMKHGPCAAGCSARFINTNTELLQ